MVRGCNIWDGDYFLCGWIILLKLPAWSLCLWGYQVLYQVLFRSPSCIFYCPKTWNSWWSATNYNNLGALGRIWAVQNELKKHWNDLFIPWLNYKHRVHWSKQCITVYNMNLMITLSWQLPLTFIHLEAPTFTHFISFGIAFFQKQQSLAALCGTEFSMFAFKIGVAWRGFWGCVHNTNDHITTEIQPRSCAQVCILGASQLYYIVAVMNYVSFYITIQNSKTV